jgi:hypothetical protein
MPVDRLPAAEVRRRGDARRHRRTALQVAAAVVAVAAVVGGVSLVTGAPSRTVPQPPPASQGPAPTQDPSPTGPTEAADPDVRTAIPADFPLAEDLPGDTGPDQQLEGPAPNAPAFDEVRACDSTLLSRSSAGTVDRLAVTFSQPEDYRARELTTYSSADDAAARLSSVASLFADCPRETAGGPPAFVNEVEPGRLGDESWTITRRADEYAPGIEVLVAVRVGNAVLLTSESNEGGGSAESVRASKQLAEEATAPLVDAMCLFADGGCTEAEPLDPDVLLSRLDVLRVTGFLTKWSGPDSTFSADECWSSVPATLFRDGTITVRYEGRGRDDADVVNARVLSTVTPFGSADAAADAFDAARERIDACGSADEELAAREGDATYWRLITKPAPEVCTECGAGWLHATGIGLVGERVVSLNVSWIGDLETIVGDDDPAPVSELLDRAIRQAGS